MNSLSTKELDDRIELLISHINDAGFDIYAFMNMAVQEVLQLTSATGAVLELVDGSDMVYQAATGVMNNHVGLRLPVKGSITGLCVETSTVLISEDTEKDPRVNLDACRKIGARALVVAPLFHMLKPVGVLKIVSDKPNSFTEQDVEVLKKIANCLGTALGRQVYYELRNSF